MDVFDPLRDAGLEITMHHWDAEEVSLLVERAQQRRAAGIHYPIPYFYYAQIRKPPDHPTYNSPPAFTAASGSSSPRALDSLLSSVGLHIENRTACWWRIWEAIPGPRVHEFHCNYPSLDDAVPAILHYYCGSPTRVGAWVVPFHRHPELVPMKVRSVISRARQTTTAALERHQAVHRSKRQIQWTLGRRDTWSWAIALRRQYVAVDHYADSDLILYLRRDSQAAWIVERHDSGADLC